MSRWTETDFGKKYRPIFIGLVVFLGVVVLTNLPKLYKYLTHNSGDKTSVLTENLVSSTRAVAPSFPREVLTKDAVIFLTNKARADQGLSPLVENHLLNAIAQARAQDMLRKQYFAHVSPAGEQASDIAQRVGYVYRRIAENIATGDYYTNQKIIDGWMQSPGHRENILSEEIRDIGAAVLRGRMKGHETFVAVQIFGLASPPVKQKPCVTPSDSLSHDVAIKKAELERLTAQIDRLKHELDDEQESIVVEQRRAENDPEMISRINERIHAFNEKSRWHNRLVSQARAKASVTDAMIKDYNQMLEDYNACISSE